MKKGRAFFFFKKVKEILAVDARRSAPWRTDDSVAALETAEAYLHHTSEGLQWQWDLGSAGL